MKKDRSSTDCLFREKGRCKNHSIKCGDHVDTSTCGWCRKKKLPRFGGGR